MPRGDEKIMETDNTTPTTTSATPEPVSPAEEENSYLTGYNLWTTSFSLTAVGFLLLLDVAVVTTAIPKITTEFHSLEDVGWYGTAYLITQCAIQPLTGKIYTEFDMKWTFLCFFGIFELGSAICGAAQSSKMLIIGRALAGMGGSGLLNGAYSIIHACAPLNKQPLLMGILIGVSQVGILFGPVIGGVLTQYASWRWCFYINLPSGGLVTIVLLLVLHIPAHKHTESISLVRRLEKLDLVGFAIFTPGIIQLILALEWGGDKYAWNSAKIIGLFCGSFGTLLVFVAWQNRMGKRAMIPLSIIRRHVVWFSMLNYASFFGAMLSATYYMPIYFQAVKNATPTLSGVDLLPSIISTMLCSVCGGALMGRVGYYMPFGILSGALVALGSGLTSTWTPTTSTGVWIGYQIILGAGRGIGFQVPIVAVQNNSAKEEVPIVNALVVFGQTLGGAVFLSVDGIIFSSNLKKYLAKYAPELSPETVIAAGATGIREAVPASSLAGVILAYDDSYKHVMYLAAGTGVAACLFAFGMGWVNIKKKAENEKTETACDDEKAAEAV